MYIFNYFIYLEVEHYCPIRLLVIVPCQEVQGQLERICEMGQVMRKAVQVDDQHYCSVQERLAQLEVSHLSINTQKQFLHIGISDGGNQVEQRIECFSSLE